MNVLFFHEHGILYWILILLVFEYNNYYIHWGQIHQSVQRTLLLSTCFGIDKSGQEVLDFLAHCHFCSPQLW